MIISSFTAFRYDADEHKNDMYIFPVQKSKWHG